MNILLILIWTLLLSNFTLLKAQTYLQIENSNNKLESILAEIGDINITQEEFLKSFEFAPAFIKRRPDSKLRHLKFMIKEKLLALDGYSRKVDTMEQAKETLNAIEDDLATEELFKDEILGKIKISDKEIDSAVSKMQTEIEIRWLFSIDKNSIENYFNKLESGIPFDSLYAEQFNDTSVYLDDRSLNISEFALESRNPIIAAKAALLKPGEYSEIFFAYDGWYILQVVNKWTNLITAETEFNKLRSEAENAVKKRKMDRLSDEYVNALLYNSKPIIKRIPFNILRTYLANYLISQKQFEEWGLKIKLEQALDSLGNPTSENVGKIILVEYNKDNITIEEFLKWYRIRDQYLKFEKSDLRAFSVSIENYIWQMLRDKLLVAIARERGYYKNQDVVIQTSWWKDKITYSQVKNELINSIRLEIKETNLNNDRYKNELELVENELIKKMFYKLSQLQKKYKITINENLLANLQVSFEYDPNAIEFYAVKKGGLIPRIPFPTIDTDWSKWE